MLDTDKDNRQTDSSKFVPRDDLNQGSSAENSSGGCPVSSNGLVKEVSQGHCQNVPKENLNDFTYRRLLCQRVVGWVLGAWVVCTMQMQYFFSADKFLSFYGVNIYAWNISQLPIWHIMFLSGTFLFLALSFVTFILTIGINIYERVSTLNFKNIKETLLKSPGASVAGLCLSLISTMVYMLWTYFDASALQLSMPISMLFIVGTGIFMLLFVMPTIIKQMPAVMTWIKEKLLSVKECCWASKVEMTTSNHAGQGSVTWHCGWLAASALGEILISPIFLDSTQKDLRINLHIHSPAFLDVLTGSMVFISAAVMVLCTQGDISDATPSPAFSFSCRECLSSLMLFGTCVIGGAYTTYVGLQDLNFLPQGVIGIIIKAVWSCAASVYWLAFYRGVRNRIIQEDGLCQGDANKPQMIAQSVGRCLS